MDGNGGNQPAPEDTGNDVEIIGNGAEIIRDTSTPPLPTADDMQAVFADELRFIDELRECEANSHLCPSCQAMFHIGNVLWRGPGTHLVMGHHYHPQSLVAAIQYGCTLCQENFDYPHIRPLVQDVIANSDKYVPGSDPVSIFKFEPTHDRFKDCVLLSIELWTNEYAFNKKDADLWRQHWWWRYYVGPFIVKNPSGDLEPSCNPCPDPEDLLDHVLDWVNKCQDGHKSCRIYRDRKRRRPRRVLEIGESHLILRVPEDGCQETYITLSHRWSIPGRPDLPTLRRANEAEMRSPGIPLGSLPPAFQDAATIARHVGVRYLWIDSLCIFQDSAADWEREAAFMGSIYAGGLFNVAIADEACHWGTRIRQQHPRMVIPIIASASHPNLLDMGGEGVYKDVGIGPRAAVIHDGRAFHRGVARSMLLNRGWVLQEVTLAPATLFLTAMQAWWACTRQIRSETYPNGVPGAMWRYGFPDIKPLFFYPIDTPERRSFGWDYWCLAITAFSKTKFTYWLDRTKAYAGITTSLRFDFGTYCAGLWYAPPHPTRGYSFVLQLLWKFRREFGTRQGQAPVEEGGGGAEQEPGGPIIPTWSWLSCPTSVHYERVLMELVPFVTLGAPPDVKSFDRFGWPHTRDLATLHLSAILVPLGPKLYFTFIETVLAAPAVAAGVERTPRLVTISFDRYWELEELRTQSEASDGGTDGYFFMPFVYQKDYQEKTVMYGLVVKEHEGCSQARDGRRLVRRIGWFGTGGYYPAKDERFMEFPDETWTYVFADWNLGRLGRDAVRQFDLCDSWMVVNEEPDLDQVYLL